MAINSHYFVPYLNFCDSFPNLKIMYVCQIWRGVLTMSYYDPKSSFIKKYKISAFQRTFERIHITFSRWNIFIWSSKIHSVVTFLVGFHIQTELFCCEPVKNLISNVSYFLLWKLHVECLLWSTVHFLIIFHIQHNVIYLMLSKRTRRGRIE